MSEKFSYVKALRDPKNAKLLTEAVRFIQSYCHGVAKECGWWDPKGAAKEATEYLKTEEAQSLPEETKRILELVANEGRNKGELIALIHSEGSEMLEGVRKNLMDDKLSHRKMEEVEAADTIVRILDYAGGFDLDIGGALVEKLIFNTTREDHKPENRNTGKAGDKSM